MRKPKTEILKTLFNNLYANDREKDQPKWSRRSFITTTIKAGAFLGMSSIVPKFLYAGAFQPSVAIIGGGIAGLNAAWHLQKAGVNATIYEGNTSTGGRIQTVKNYFGSGLTTEIGGEFIDSNHKEMLRLVKEFNLQLKDRTTDPLHAGESKETYFVNGTHYTLAQVISEFNNYATRIKKDQNSLGGNFDTADAKRLDQTSIEQYFDSIGLTGWLRKLLDIAYTSEFGIITGEQSALNFLAMIATDTKKGFEIYGASDERFGILGGNATITDLLAQKLQSQIKTGYILNAIESKGNGYQLSFNNGQQVTADFVIAALPFTMLRNVQLKVNLPDWKRKAINELGYGDNSKLIMGFNSRPWRDNKAAGYSFNEKIHNGWDSSSVQNNNAGEGSYTCFVGADAAKQMADKYNQQQQLADEYLPVLEQIYPGANASFNGKRLVADWPNRPFIKASYAGYKVGQWTTIAGNEITPVGNLFFAGEHCSVDFQGYMNGGADTGRLAAMGVLEKLNSKKIKALSSADVTSR